MGRAVEIADQRKPRLSDAEVDAYFGVAVALPPQVGVVDDFVGLCVVDRGHPIAVFYVVDGIIAVLRIGIEDIERRQFLGDAPSAAQGQPVGDAVFHVETRRVVGRVPVVRIFDESLFETETGHQLQRRAAERQGQHLFEIGRYVVHVGDVGVGARTVAVGGRRRIVVVGAVTDVPFGPPRDAEFRVAVHPPP